MSPPCRPSPGTSMKITGVRSREADDLERRALAASARAPSPRAARRRDPCAPPAPVGVERRGLVRDRMYFRSVGTILIREACSYRLGAFVTDLHRASLSLSLRARARAPDDQSRFLRPYRTRPSAQPPCFGGRERARPRRSAWLLPRRSSRSRADRAPLPVFAWQCPRPLSPVAPGCVRARLWRARRPLRPCRSALDRVRPPPSKRPSRRRLRALRQVALGLGFLERAVERRFLL